MVYNDSITGMVSMCAGCNVYEPWAALLIGLVAGMFFYIFEAACLPIKNISKFVFKDLFSL